MAFENIASGIGGVTVIAYFSALCDLRFTAAQYALISAAASVVGRVLTATTTGRLVDAFGYVDFYWGTTVGGVAGRAAVLVDERGRGWSTGRSAARASRARGTCAAERG